MTEEFPSEDIFERLLRGETVCVRDPQYRRIGMRCQRTCRLLAAANSNVTTYDKLRSDYSSIFKRPIDPSVWIFPPFNTNYGRNTVLGKDVIINHGCSFLDLGGITVGDGVMLAPNVSIVTEGHPLKPEGRSHYLIPKAVVLQRRCWIGTGAIILPGVTVGENSIVAAGAVVSKNVPPNTVVAGVPAKVIRTLPTEWPEDEKGAGAAPEKMERAAEARAGASKL